MSFYSKKAGKRFFSRTFVVRRRQGKGLLFPAALLIFLCAAVFPLRGTLRPLLRSLLRAEPLLACVRSASPLLTPDREASFSLNPLCPVDSVLPLLRVSAGAAKRYAAQHDSSLRATRTEEAPEGSAEPKTETIRDMRVQTLSMAANGITFNNASDYSVDADALLQSPLSFSPLSDAPRVLIVHTHTSEAYFDSPGGRSTDPSENVVRVGAEIADVLNRSGVRTVHDTTKNDEPDYNGSYQKALGVIEQNLSAYPSIEIVLDIHRDYTVRDEGGGSELYLKPTQTENGKDAAQIMFVMGTDSMGLYHPDWRHNLSFAVKLQNKLNQIHPGLCRPINVRTERFNQHATKGSMIIEVGSSSNTLDEAVRAGSYIGEAIADVLIDH